MCSIIVWFFSNFQMNLLIMIFKVTFMWTLSLRININKQIFKIAPKKCNIFKREPQKNYNFVLAKSLAPAPLNRWPHDALSVSAAFLIFFSSNYQLNERFIRVIHLFFCFFFIYIFSTWSMDFYFIILLNSSRSTQLGLVISLQNPMTNPKNSVCWVPFYE